MESKQGPMQEAVKVKNRDIPILSRVLFIMQDVVGTERKEEWQRGRLFNRTQHISGMPGGGSLPKGLDEPLAELSELADISREEIARYNKELKEAESILNAIQSQTMRTFVMMKYMLDIPNIKIMEELSMSKWRFEQARRCIEEAPDMAHADWKERYEAT